MKQNNLYILIGIIIVALCIIIGFSAGAFTNNPNNTTDITNNTTDDVENNIINNTTINNTIASNSQKNSTVSNTNTQKQKTTTTKKSTKSSNKGSNDNDIPLNGVMKESIEYSLHGSSYPYYSAQFGETWHNRREEYNALRTEIE